MIALDGSTLEGGGQLVRVALSLSAICNIPVRITNIRAGRGPQSFYRGGNRKAASSGRGGRRQESKGASDGSSRAAKKSSAGGGLKESHLAALNWLAEECNAKDEGAEVGSLEVVFKPRPRKGRRRSMMARSLNDDELDVIELRNPGSVWLIWQAIFPYITFSLLDSNNTNNNTSPADSDQPAFRIRLRGGTNVPKSPSSEYMQQVFLPLCEKIGLPRVNVQVTRRGWTTGAPEIGEVDISVFRPASVQNTASGENRATPMEMDSKHTDTDTGTAGSGAGFRLQSFTMEPLKPFTITSVSMTVLTGSPQTHSLLLSRLTASLRLVPCLSSPALPIHTHPSSTSSSGDERRIYILLTAHLSDGRHVLGRDYLAPGRKISDEADRKRMVDEAVQHVVREFKREVERERCVDEFAEDQLVVFQAMAEGRSRVNGGRGSGKGKDGEARAETGSLHTRTVRWVCREMLGTEFDGVGGCEGGGWVRQNATIEEITGGVGDLTVNEEEE